MLDKGKKRIWPSKPLKPEETAPADLPTRPPGAPPPISAKRKQGRPPFKKLQAGMTKAEIEETRITLAAEKLAREKLRSEPLKFIGTPWSKQPWETFQSYQCFVVYLNLGKNRSIDTCIRYTYPDTESLARATGRKPGAKYQRPKDNHEFVAMWCADYQWVRRSAAWDDYLSAVGEQISINSAKKMHMQHAELFEDMFLKAGKVMQEIFTDPVRLLQMDIDDVRKCMETAAKWERLARGISGDENKPSVGINITNNNQGNVNTQINNGAADWDLKCLSPDELRSLLAIKQKAMQAKHGGLINPGNVSQEDQRSLAAIPINGKVV